MERLDNLFNEVRSCFFPRWDTNKQWKVEARLEWHQSLRVIDWGFCDDKHKTIRIWPAWVCQDDNALRVLLIHEIAHATERCNHQPKWQARCLKAASKAEGMGNQRLADAIRLDVKPHQYSTPLDEVRRFRKNREAETKATLDRLSQIADTALNEFGRLQLQKLLFHTFQKNSVAEFQ